MTRGFLFWVLCTPIRIALFFYHPVFRVYGRENVPKDSKCIICANHRGMADPFWIVFALGVRYIPRVMAKKEVMSYPILNRIFEKIGIIPVDREGADVQAIKTSIRALKQDQQLLIFPEGTRCKPGVRVAPKRGAMMLAAATDSPILPVYISVDRKPFGPMTCIIGEPYRLQIPSKRPTDEQLEQEAQKLMDRIYEMGETA